MPQPLLAGRESGKSPTHPLLSKGVALQLATRPSRASPPAPNEESITMSTFVATDPEGYEQYVGRVSQRLAPVFVNHVGISPRERVLDVGCGTGNLTIALDVAKEHATGVDLSAPYVEFARRRASGAGLAFDVGDALNLPYPDGKFDRSVSMLAVDVLP